MFGWFRALVRTRAGLPALHAAGESAVLQPDSPHVLAWRRRRRAASFVGLVNFAEEPTSVDVRLFAGLGVLDAVLASDGPPASGNRAKLWLSGLSFVWLAEVAESHGSAPRAASVEFSRVILAVRAEPLRDHGLQVREAGHVERAHLALELLDECGSTACAHWTAATRCPRR